MRKFGLIGYPLSHSFSQKYFSNKFLKEAITGCCYNNYPLENIHLFRKLVETEKELVGLNVTIPYKEQVIPFLNDIDKDAKDIGAVNTISITRSKAGIHLKGYNSDVYGFRKPLEEVLKSHHTHALILGTGGASKAVAWVLKTLNIKYSFVSRNPVSANDYSYTNLTADIVNAHSIIINTSPIGMSPDIQKMPDIPYTGISDKHILYDLVYNPEMTLFLQKGAEKKAILISGLPMLYLQAEKSWEIWNSQ
jgi:shikimate dehydrogenase